MTFWAWSVGALLLLHAVWGMAWPRLFQRGVVSHAQRVPEGWQMGRLVLWQLPARTAVVIASASVVPVLVGLLLEGWVRIALLAAVTAGAVLLWLAASPGSRGGLFPMDTPEPAFVLRFDGGRLRAIAVLLLAGALPSCAVGALAALLWP